jgi:hypothetical protein
VGAAQYQNSHARFFVLRDHVYGPGTQRLKHVTASERRGISTLNFDFAPRGQREFRQLTAGIARRGASLGKPNDPFLQHVAVIEDGTLLSVAQIDYRFYPEGIDPATGGIPTGLLTSTTQHIARELTQGIQSLALQVISRYWRLKRSKSAASTNHRQSRRCSTPSTRQPVSAECGPQLRLESASAGRETDHGTPKRRSQ